MLNILKNMGDQILSIYKQLELSIFLVIFCWVGYHFINALKVYQNTRKWPENFVSNKEKLINDNSFKQITLPKYNDYDIEMAIPSGQILHNTVQGNWGLSTDSFNKGATLGIYRDGFSADGAIYKGKSGKKYKRMLEQGPYTLKYSFRKGQQGQDVKIFVNDNLIHDLKNEGVTSDKFKVVGTNEFSFNKKTESQDRGRRPIDYIKFIPMVNLGKESFSNINIFNIEDFIVKEGFQTTISKQMQDKNAEKIRNYLNEIKDITPRDYTENRQLREEYEENIKRLMDNRWRGYEYAVSPAYYSMHNDIANGISYDVIILRYKHIIHDKQKLLNNKKGNNYFNKKINDNTVEQILHDLGEHNIPVDKEKLPSMMEKSIGRIKSITFTEKESYFNEVNPNNPTYNFEDMNKNEVFEEPLWKKITDKDKKMRQKLDASEIQAGNLIMAGNSKQNNLGYCPKNCVKSNRIDGNCEKDIIRMVVDGVDKFYRKCPHRCKNRFEKHYVNYDRSGPGNPYNVKRDGCRYSQAQCSANCSKTLVEVDKEGRDLNESQYNYTNVNEQSSKMFVKKQTTGLFNVKENRLGGSRTAYKTDYKPLNPNPRIGPVNYDSVWNFKA